jgi:hypothetical protein
MNYWKELYEQAKNQEERNAIDRFFLMMKTTINSKIFRDKFKTK